MSAEPICPHCRQPLPSGLLGGLCPRCIAQTLRRSVMPGDRIRYLGDYELIEEIGRGGMGVVFKARQLSLDRFLALKLIRTGQLAGEVDISRFRAEAAAAARLESPNIVAIYEVGEHEGEHYFTMQLVEGAPLSELTDVYRHDPRKAADLMVKVARAVHHAHQRGILHRDLKPGNIVVDEDGEPHVTDFGLARRVDWPAGATEPEGVAGTPDYMSPEQAQGDSRCLTTATDIWGLGAVLYHLITGHAPAHRSTQRETLQAVVHEEATRPRCLNRRVDRDLEAICLKCLEKDPQRRYGSAEALAEDLERWLRQESITARPGRPGERLVKWTRRKPGVAALAAVSVLLFLLGLAGVLWQWRQATRYAEAEARERRRAEAGEKTAQGRLYAADMLLAEEALEASNLGRARQLLSRHWQPGQADFREWVWRRLWARCQTPEVALLTGYSRYIHAVALSPNGRWLATVSARDAIRLWDMPTRRCVTTKPNPSFAYDNILFSPDSQSLFLSRAEDQSVQVWKVPNLELAVELPRPSRVDTIALSPDGRLLAAADRQQVTLWHTWPFREWFTISVKQRLACGRIAFSPDGLRLAFNDYEGRIYIWDLATRKLLHELAGHRRVPPWQPAILALAFAPDGLTLVSGGVDLTLRLWDVNSGRELKRLTSHADAVWQVAFSPDGGAMASASCDQTVRLWEVANWQPRSVLRGHENEVWCVTFSADGQTLVSGGKDGSVRIWNAHPQPDRVWSWDLPSDARGLALAADARQIALLRTNGALSLVEAVRWQERASSPAPLPAGETGALALSPDASLLVTARPGGTLDAWKLPAFTRTAGFTGHTQRVDLLAFSENGQWLASAGRADAMIIHAVSTGQEAVHFPQSHGDVKALALSPDGVLLGASFTDDVAEIWERATGRLRMRFVPHRDAILDIVFMHHQARFFTGGSDGTVRVWDLRSGRNLGEFRGSRRGVNRLALSADDRTLAVGTGEGTVMIRDLQLNQQLASLPFDHFGVMGLAFSRDGRTLVSANLRQIRIWEAPPLGEIELNPVTR